MDGINYYRLKQTDFDGSYEYTKMVAITLKQSNNLSIYPNPSETGEVFLELGEPSKGMVSIYNIQGELLKQEILIEEKKKFMIRLSEIPQGVYILEFSTNEEEFSKKLIVK